MDSLYKDPIQSIFYWLDFRSLFRCARVCKKWKNIFYSERVWICRNRHPDIWDETIIRIWPDPLHRTAFIRDCTFEYRILGLFRCFLEDPENLPGSLIMETIPLCGFPYGWSTFKAWEKLDDLAKIFCPDYELYQDWENYRTWNACIRRYFRLLSPRFFDGYLEISIPVLRSEDGSEVIVYFTDPVDDSLPTVIDKIQVCLERQFGMDPIELHPYWINITSSHKKKRKSPS